MSYDSSALLRFVALAAEDAAASDAVRQAGIDAGEPKPQTVADNMAAGIMSANGGSWSTTPAAQVRWREAFNEQAREGALAYLLGQPGNAYTRYLVKRFGSVSGRAEVGSSGGFWNGLRDFWRELRSHHPVVQGIVWAIFGAACLFVFSKARSGPLAIFGVLIFGTIVTFLVCSLALCVLGFFVGVFEWIGTLRKKPGTAGKDLLQLVGIFLILVAVGALGGTAFWWVAAKVARAAGNSPDSLGSAIGLGLSVTLGIPGIILFFMVTHAGYKQVERWKPQLPGLVPVVEPVVPPAELPSGEAGRLAAEYAVPTAAPESDATVPVTLSRLNEPVPWWQGCTSGDRFGPKEFEAALATDLSAIDLLSQVSRLLTQLSTVQPWKIIPQIKGAPDGDSVGFAANGAYEWDNSPYVAEEGDGLVMVQDMTGQRKGGTGAVHLECTARLAPTDDRVDVTLQFSEASQPMWLRRQAEAFVARTLAELTELLAADLQTGVQWFFTRGDWMTYQQVNAGRGVFEIKSGYK